MLLTVAIRGGGRGVVFLKKISSLSCFDAQSTVFSRYDFISNLSVQYYSKLHQKAEVS